MYNSREIEKKWQKRWTASNLFDADPDPKKNKKFITNPYPYASENPLNIIVHTLVEVLNIWETCLTKLS